MRELLTFCFSSFLFFFFSFSPSFFIFWNCGSQVMKDDEGDGVLNIGIGHSPCLTRNIGSVLEIPHKANTTPSSRTRTHRPPTTIPSLALIYVPRKRLQLETLSLSTDWPTIAYFTGDYRHLLIETPFAMVSGGLKSGVVTQCVRFVHGCRVAISIRLN